MAQELYGLEVSWEHSQFRKYLKELNVLQCGCPCFHTLSSSVVRHDCHVHTLRHTSPGRIQNRWRNRFFTTTQLKSVAQPRRGFSYRARPADRWIPLIIRINSVEPSRDQTRSLDNTANINIMANKLPRTLQHQLPPL